MLFRFFEILLEVFSNYMEIIVYLFLLYFTLQYCIGFAIHQHESATGVHVFPILKPLPPPSLYHPSGSSQCTSLKHPVSCIDPGLVIPFIYDIIHVIMPFSQIIPPSLSPTESKRLQSKSPQAINAGEGVEKRESSDTVDGNAN